MADPSVITVHDQQAYQAAINGYATHGYTPVHSDRTSITLSRKKPFNWPLAIICLFIPFIGWAALAYILMASGRRSEVVRIVMNGAAASTAALVVLAAAIGLQPSPARAQTAEETLAFMLGWEDNGEATSISSFAIRTVEKVKRVSTNPLKFSTGIDQRLQGCSLARAGDKCVQPPMKPEVTEIASIEIKLIAPCQFSYKHSNFNLIRKDVAVDEEIALDFRKAKFTFEEHERTGGTFIEIATGTNIACLTDKGKFYGCDDEFAVKAGNAARVKRLRLAVDHFRTLCKGSAF